MPAVYFEGSSAGSEHENHKQKEDDTKDDENCGIDQFFHMKDPYFCFGAHGESSCHRRFLLITYEADIRFMCMLHGFFVSVMHKKMKKLFPFLVFCISI